MDYELKWEQNMGGNRGIPVRIAASEWEAGMLVWKALVRDAPHNEVRNFEVTYKGKPFDPEKGWPRPLAILGW